MGKLPQQIIDCHVHVMDEKRMITGVKWLTKVLPNVDVEVHLSETEICNKLTEHKVTKYFNFFFPLIEGTTALVNEWNLLFSARDTRAIPFFSLLPSEKDKLWLMKKYLVEHNFFGVKMHPYAQNFNLRDVKLMPVYEYLQNLGKPLVIHTGYEGSSFATGSQAGEIVQLLNDFPDLTVVLSHVFYPNLELGFSLAKEFPQIYLDLSNAVYSYLEDQSDFDLWTKIVDFQDRVMFGTDYPLGMSLPVRLFKQLEESPLDDEVLEQICYKTAAVFIGRFGKNKT